MQIFIKISTGESIILDVSPSAKIEDIKTMIQNQKGIPKNQQRLIFKQKITQD